MKNYKFSILLPHINEWFLLDIMLDSIYNKVKYDNFEILIADDGSDNLSDLNFIKKHPLKNKIKIYYFKSAWPWKIRDFLWKEASWDILIFSDSHMYFVWDFLVKINKIFNNNDIWILQATVWDFNNKSLNCEVLYMNKLDWIWYWYSSNDSKQIIEIPMMVWNSTIIKKSIFQKIGWYNVFMVWRWSEDIELSMRAWLHWYKCYLTKEIKFIHHFRKSFNNYNVKFENMLRNKLIFVYSCFQTKKYIDEFVKNIRLYYSGYEKSFDNIHNSLLQDKDFFDWVEIQRKNYKYDDNWYLTKFKQYYDFEKESM